MRRNTGVILAATLAAWTAQAQGTNDVKGVKEAKAKTGLSADAGADLRFRYDFKDNAPKYQNNKTSATATDPQDKKHQDYYRLRTRVWGKVSYEDLTLFGRVADEFRGYHNAKDQYDFPDELFIDNLYLDIKNLWDERVDLRIGRQDLKYGAGRVISDGTGGDGSRSAYFDAVKAVLHLSEKSTLDLAGVWQRPEDDWTWGDTDYELTKYQSQTETIDSDLTERAGIAYFRNTSIDELPFEAYSIYKDETRWFASNGKRLPARRYDTLGVRVVPQLSEKWSAEAEGALQVGQIEESGAVGERDILAWMTYGGLTYTETLYTWKPYATVAVLYLSGDDDRYDDPAAGGTDTGWNPVFNRSTWFSELMSGEYATYRWSNLIYPHAEVGVRPAKDHTAFIQGGPHYAAEQDNANDDAYRGLFLMARYDFPLVRKAIAGRGDLNGAVLCEMLDAGDYYGEPETAYYLRFEISAKF